MNELETKTGKRPSPGSVYPVLKSMEELEYISSKQEGKLKIYSLTTKGKRYGLSLLKKRNTIMANKIELLKELNDGKDSEEIRTFFCKLDSLMEQSKNIALFHGLMSDIHTLVTQKNFNEKEEEFLNIFRQTKKKIIKLIEK